MVRRPHRNTSSVELFACLKVIGGGCIVYMAHKRSNLPEEGGFMKEVYDHITQEFAYMLDECNISPETHISCIIANKTQIKSGRR